MICVTIDDDDFDIVDILIENSCGGLVYCPGFIKGRNYN